MGIKVRIKRNNINESSINRIIGWIDNYDIALISAFRGVKDNVLHPEMTKEDGKEIGEKYSTKENKSRNRELCAALLRLGYGVTKVDGVYIENFGMTNSRICDEESFLVVNRKNDDNFYKNIFKLSEYYNQDCFCYKAKGDDVAYNIGTNGANYPGYCEKERNGKFVVGVENEFMTRLKNKGFAFTDKEGLKRFSTTHKERKIERNNKRLENHMNEELDVFEKYGILGMQSIANVADKVIKNLN